MYEFLDNLLINIRLILIILDKIIIKLILLTQIF